MDDTESVAQACIRLQTLLARDALEPAPNRNDWSVHRAELASVRKLIDDEILPAATRDDAGLRSVVTEALCSAAPLLYVSGHADDARRLIERAKALAEDETDVRVLDEATWNIDRFARLWHARWLVEHERDADARKLAARLATERQSPAIAEAARAIAEQPQPLASAPTLFTLNGFGVSIWGSRDFRSDGSYVTTRFLVALFVPILPLDAYRVIPAGHRRYVFLAKMPLGRVARLWRALFVSALVAAGAGWGAFAWWTSPTQRLHRALEAARAAESRAKDPRAIDQAAGRYEKLVTDYFASVTPLELEPAAAGIARLCAAGVPAHLDADHVEAALRAVRRFAALPRDLRAGEGANIVVASVSKWSDALRADDRARAAALELLDAGARALEGAPASKLASRRDALTLGFAERIVHDWPLAALRLFSALPTNPAALRGAAAVVGRLGDDPSTWAELAPTLAAWAGGVRLARLADLDPLTASATDHVAKARAELAAPERKTLIESGDAAKLAEALKLQPRDQGLAVELAALDRDCGDTKAAIAVLESVAPPGLLTTAAAQALAGAESDSGRWADAEVLLSHMLAQRMPAYQQARDQFDAAAEAIETRLWQQAKEGTLPAELARRLDGVSDDDAPAEFHKIVSEQLDDDADLKRMQERLAAASDVVPIAVQLGTIQLQHASETSGDTRARLLASAERTFLSIQASAGGMPSFHLGLGQVYHRLGKAKEGDKELNQLLEGDDYEMHLSVARAYRGLGLVTRARQIATQVYETAPEHQRQEAAVLMGLMASEIDEYEKWFKRADPKSNFVRTTLLEIEGQRRQETGDRVGAAAKLLAAAHEHERDAEHDTSAANNAALDYSQRYLCTGDLADLDAAIRLFDRALSLSPDDALVVNNAVPPLLYRAELAAISPWLHERALRLTESETALLLDDMLSGEHRREIVDRLTRDKDYVRARRLIQQVVVLAPARPDAWQTELELLTMLNDENGLKAFQARVARIPSLDLGSDEDNLREWLVGARDDKARRRARVRLDQLHKTREALDAGDAASIAAVEVLEADVHDDLAIVDTSSVEAEAALSSLRAADKTWPAIGARSALGHALLAVAVLRTADAEPELAKAVKAEYRELGATLVLQQLLLKHSAALATLARDPALAEADSLRRSLAVDSASPSDWMLAALLHDAKLAELGRSAFDDPLDAYRSRGHAAAHGRE